MRSPNRHAFPAAILHSTVQNFQKRICPSTKQLIKTQIKLIQSHTKRVIALTLTLKTLKILTFVVEHTMKLKNCIKKFHVRVRILTRVPRRTNHTTYLYTNYTALQIVVLYTSIYNNVYI